LDQGGEPLPGAVITVVGSTRGSATDEDGKFELTNIVKGTKLLVTYLGFKDKQFTFEDKNDIVIVLEESASELEEVMVVGFGKQKKESVVASITTINPNEMRVPTSNLTTALAGRISGVISYQRSGEPGLDQNNAEFFIRGVTTFGTGKKDPLILIDGVEMSTADLARMTLDDIASFSVLKDANATALYGARGANGVILVTTKQGTEGKTKLFLRLENSFSSPTSNVELADPVTFMRLENEAVLTRMPTGQTRYSDAKIARTALGEDPLAYPANDWRSLLFKDYAVNQRVNLNVSGGGKVARYYVAASYSSDNGILKVDKRNNFNSNIDLKKYTLRSNVNINLTKTTEMIVRLSGSFDDYRGPLDGGAEMYNKVMHANPVLFPAYFTPTESNQYVKHIMFGNYQSSSGGFLMNPYADMVRGYKEYSRSQMIAQFELKQDLERITPGLSLRGMFNTTRNTYFDVSRAYNPYWYSFVGYNVMTGEPMLNLMNEDGGSEYLGYSQGPKEIDSDVYFESALDYNREFGKHSVSGLLVFIMKNTLEGNSSITDLQQSLPHRNVGLSGRATYGYDKRYFTELNFGYNGSERFSKKHRFGFFPAVGLGWALSGEKFWSPYRRAVNNLKIRGTYGLVGNDAIGSSADRFFYLSRVTLDDTGKRAYFGENQSSYWRNGVSISNYANDAITWEVSKKQNYALEVGLFDKVNIIAEYFREYRTKILMSRSYIPNTMGLQADVRANVGEASSKGTDISIDYAQAWGDKLWVSARGNFTYATNRYEVYEEPIYAEPWRTRVGYSIDQTRGYIAEKLFIDDAEVANSPAQFGDYKAGDIKYTDVNGDGVITGADQVPIGNPTKPEIVYGFGFSVGYRDFDFSTFFQGLANESFWISYSSTAPFVNETQILKAYADSHWSEDNRNVYALWPRLSNYLISNNNQTSTWFMRDGSFVRLKQLEFGYTLPEKLLAQIGASSLRVYFSGTNLLLFSRFKMWDVEMGGNGLGYPLQKTLNLGLNVSF